MKALNPAYKTLIAPYGTRSAAWVMALCAQLERLEVDYIAYQDEVGVRKPRWKNCPAFMSGSMHTTRWGGPGCGPMWEAFQFEGEVYHSPASPPLLPAAAAAAGSGVSVWKNPDLSVSGAAECFPGICFLRPSRFRDAVPRLGGVAGRGSL